MRTLVISFCLSVVSVLGANASSASSASSSDEALEQSIQGAWEHFNTSDLRKVRLVSDGFWCVMHFHAPSGELIWQLSGTYQIENGIYTQIAEAGNTAAFDQRNIKHQFTVSVEGDLLRQVGLNNGLNEVWNRMPDHSQKENAADGVNALAGVEGAWIQAQGNRNLKTVRLITGGQWALVTFKPDTKETIYTLGGSYFLRDGEYQQAIEYTNSHTRGARGTLDRFAAELEGPMMLTRGLNNPWKGIWVRFQP